MYVDTLPSEHRTRTRCLVCGFAEVRTDVVLERGFVLLRECPRCLHRDTSTLPLPVGPVAMAGSARREVA